MTDRADAGQCGIQIPGTRIQNCRDEESKGRGFQWRSWRPWWSAHFRLPARHLCYNRCRFVVFAKMFLYTVLCPGAAKPLATAGKRHPHRGILTFAF